MGYKYIPLDITKMIFRDPQPVVIASTFKSINYLMTLEALFIKDIKPTINTKDEYLSRALVIKI